MLKATIENDSAKQAEYLTGINKKYGAKAILRSDTINMNSEEILKKVKSLGHSLKEALVKDQSKSSVKDLETSILSLNSPFEQLAEWVDSIEKIDDSNFHDVYSFLVCFGLPAYPVKFENNNAVQMDPF